MLKLFFIAAVIVAGGDLALNHGAGIAKLTHALTGLFTFAAHMGEGSIFTK